MKLINKVFLVILFVELFLNTLNVFGKELDNSAFKNYLHPAEINIDHTDGTWGEENKGLIAKIWIEKKEYIIGEPVTVHYIVKNISDKEIITWHSGFWPNHLIIVTMPDASKVTSKDLGLSFDPGGSRDKNVPWLIKPGEIDNALSSYDISKFFGMDKPGVYFVQYLYEEYQGGWEGKLWSNILEIRILKRR